MIFVSFGSLFLILYLLVFLFKKNITIKGLLNIAKEKNFTFINYLIVFVFSFVVIWFAIFSFRFIVEFLKYCLFYFLDNLG